MALGEDIFHFVCQMVPSKGTVKCEVPFVSAPLPRVPDFLHSGKSLALGEYQLSRSDLN
jgi:hypothetical protein